MTFILIGKVSVKKKKKTAFTVFELLLLRRSQQKTRKMKGVGMAISMVKTMPNLWSIL